VERPVVEFIVFAFIMDNNRRTADHFECVFLASFYRSPFCLVIHIVLGHHRRVV
jgi:hypothetical protein